MSAMNPAADWSNFLIAAAGAAAALTGLIFVAISINLARILESPGVTIRASEAIVILLGPLLICLVALAPNQPEKVLGTELLFISVFSWLIGIIGQIRSHLLRLPHPTWWLAQRVVLYQLSVLPFLMAGLSLMFGWRGAMYWLIPGCLFSFVAATHSAWILLIEILR
jgi:hypothetical protein